MTVDLVLVPDGRDCIARATFIQKQELKSVTLTYIESLGWQNTKLSTLYRAVFVMLELRYKQSITTAVLSLHPCLSYFIRHFILVWRVCLKPIIFSLYAHQQPFILLLSIMGLVIYAFFGGSVFCLKDQDYSASITLTSCLILGYKLSTVLHEICSYR